jgi:hypothetical protein
MVVGALILVPQTVSAVDGVTPTPLKLQYVSVDKIPDDIYTGKPIVPAPVVIYLGNPLIADTDYTVSYTNNVNVGVATVTITGIGNYEGTRTENFNINPKATTLSKITVGKKQMKATWKKVKTASKYEVRYRIKGATTWNFAVVSKKKVSLTIDQQIRTGKTYQVQVRYYQTVAKKKYYSDWSNVKTSKKIK